MVASVLLHLLLAVLVPGMEADSAYAEHFGARGYYGAFPVFGLITGFLIATPVVGSRWVRVRTIEPLLALDPDVPALNHLLVPKRREVLTVVALVVVFAVALTREITLSTIGVDHYDFADVVNQGGAVVLMTYVLSPLFFAVVGVSIAVGTIGATRHAVGVARTIRLHIFRAEA